MAGDVIASLLIKLGLNADGVKAGIGDADRMMGGLSGNMQRHASLMAAGAGAAVGGFAVSSMQAMAGFDDRMREIFSIMPGIGKDAMSAMSSDVRRVATEMGLDVETVASGVYDAISSGIDPKGVTDFIRVASKAAIAGVSDTKTASTLLSATLNAYSMDATHAEEVADTLFQTVKVGVTTFPELAASMAAISPVASVMGVDLESTTAALAAMTLQGFDTAKASTDIAAVFTLLQKGTPGLTRVLEDAGFATGQAALDALGFQGTLEMLRAGADKLGIAIPTMTGRVEAAGAIFALTGDKTDAAREVLESYAGSTGAVTDAFKVMDSGIGGTVRHIQAQMQDLSITVGQTLEPIAPLFLAFGPQMGRLLGAGLGAAAGLAFKGLLPLTKVAIAAAGAAAGLVYQGAAFVASKLIAAAVAAWALMGGPRVMAAASAAGAKTGAAFAGAAAGGGILGSLAGAMLRGVPAVLGALGPVAIAVSIAWVIKKPLDEVIDEQFGKVGRELTSFEDMGAFAAEAIKRGFLPLGGTNFIDPATGQKISENIRREIREHIWGPTVEDVAEDGAKAVGTLGDKLAGAWQQRWSQAATELHSGIDEFASSGALQGQAAFDRWASTLSIGAIGRALGDLSRDVIDGGEPVIDAFGDVFDEAVHEITKGFGNVKQALEGGSGIVSPEKRMENMRSRLEKASANLRKAIAVGDPIGIDRWTKGVARASSVLDQYAGKTGQTRREVAAELDAMGLHSSRVFGNMGRDTKKKSKDAADAAISESRRTTRDIRRSLFGLDAFSRVTWSKIERDTKTKAGDAADAAIGETRRMRRAIGRTLSGLGMENVGRNTIQSWIDGIMSMRAAVMDAGRAAADWLGRFFHGSAVPKVGPLAGFDHMGADMVGAWLGGIDRQESRVKRTGDRLASALQPSLSPAAAGAMRGGGRVGGTVINVNVGKVYGGPAGLRELAAEIERAIRPTRRERRRVHLAEG